MAFGVLLVTGAMTHQEGYAAGFRADPRAKVVAVSDEKDVDGRRAGLNRKLAGELGVPYIPDLDDALGRADVDLVSITTEHHRQGRVSIRCAQAGKHVYLDKPLAGNLEEARELERIVKRRGLRSQMFTQVLFPPAQRARRLVASGVLGELRAVHADLLFAKGFADNQPVRPRRENATPNLFLVPDAKREMFNIAVYSLALIRWLSGRKAFRSVRSVTGNYFLAENRVRDFEDFGILAVNLEGGLTATIASGRTGWRSHAGSGHLRTKLIGSRGNLFLDGQAARGELCFEGQTYWRVPAVNKDDPQAFWASSDQRKTGAPEWFLPPLAPNIDQSGFLDALERGREAEVTVSDGVRILEALFAAYRSASSGELVAIS
ncbi:MAG: Gfo/Idh/MocA family oxidoreductase [Bryobacterales bacterium]|nr:Gfo/Idh/MocA family oxidoreductase [Bryobacterales bacterium]